MRSFLFISTITSLIILMLLFHRKHYGNEFKRKMYYWVWLILAIRLLFPIDISGKTAVYNIKSPEIKNNNSVERIIENKNINIEEKTPTIDKVLNKNIELENIDKKINIKGFSLREFISKNYKKIYFIGLSLYFSINLIIYYRQKHIIRNKTNSLDREVYYRFIELKGEMIPNKKLELKISDFTGSPMVMGVFSPILYIPKYTKIEELEHILRHEFIHIKRNDTVYKFILFLTRTIHWFNPIVHIMGKKAYEDIELSCDERVVESLDSEEKIAYGKTLISAIEKSFYHSAFTTNFGGGKNMIKKRIDIIFNSIKKKSGRSIISLTLIVIMSTGLLIGCSDVAVNTEKDFENSVEKGVNDILNGTGKIVDGAMNLTGNIISNITENRIEKISGKLEKSMDKLNNKFVNIGAIGKLNYKNTISPKEDFIVNEKFNDIKLDLIATDLVINYGDENKIEYVGDNDLDELKLEFEVANDTLKINEYSKNSRINNLNTKCILTLEKELYNSMKLGTVSGNIMVDNLKANKNISIDTSSGYIEINTVNADDIQLEIVSGNLDIKNIFANSYLKLDNSSGFINLENIKTKEFDLNTISGDIDIYKVNALEGNIDSSSGNISIMEGDIDYFTLYSVSGDIDLIGDAKNMNIDTSSGDVSIKGKSDDIKVETISGDIVIAGVNKNSSIFVDGISSDINIFGNNYSELVDIKGKDGNIRIESSSGNILVE